MTKLALNRTPVAFAAFVALGAACAPAPSSAPSQPLAMIRAEAHTYLASLAKVAEQRPSDKQALKASGMAHMRFALSGMLSARDTAERHLEAAFELDPNDRLLTRSLGRFYNFREVAGDYSKAEQQVKVYRAYLGEQSVESMERPAFVSWSFFQLGEILDLKNRGNPLAALSRVRKLEAELRSRTETHPDTIEYFALAGNFAFFFAGNIPVGRQARVEQAVDYFRVLRARWDELRFGARDPQHCPNTFENFMFELAEGLVVLEQLDEARDIYQMLSEIRPPITRGKELIAHVSQERLRNIKQYAGDMSLMPPWPSDAGNCVVCHAYNAEIPLNTLVTVEPFLPQNVPTRAIHKPIPVGDVPSDVRSIVQMHCVRCHKPNGAGGEWGDFTFDEGIWARAVGMGREVDAGSMPPDSTLDAESVATIIRFARSLTPEAP